MSAVPNVRSENGRHKLYLERRLADAGACVVRPGLVVGDGGMVRSAFDTMRHVHLVPLVDGGDQPFQYVGLNDLATAVRLLVEMNMPGKVVTVAAEGVISARIIAEDVRRRFGMSAVLVSVPYGVIAPIVACLERCGFEPPVTTENLLGLKALTIQPVTDVRATLGVGLKRWADLLTDLTFVSQ